MMATDGRRKVVKSTVKVGSEKSTEGEVI